MPLLSISNAETASMTDAPWWCSNEIAQKGFCQYSEESAVTTLTSQEQAEGVPEMNPWEWEADRQRDIRESLLPLYFVRNPQRVFSFIQDNPFLQDLLVTASFLLRAFFPGSSLTLDFIEDPEDPEDKEVVAYVMTDLSVDDALARLEAFDRSWWLEHVHESRLKLVFDLEFA